MAEFIDRNSIYGAEHRNGTGLERVILGRGTSGALYRLEAYASGLLVAIRESEGQVPWDKLSKTRRNRVPGGLPALGVSMDNKGLAEVCLEATGRGLLKDVAASLGPRGGVRLPIPDDFAFWGGVSDEDQRGYHPITRQAMRTRISWTR